MDNAPSHITTDLELSNVVVKPLPPNTTSKIQPLDAGIIAAFKRHYRRLHLQNAVDRDDRGEVELFKVDQLTAMKWCLAAWDEISPETIQNCFRHTGLFNGEQSGSDGDAAEKEVEDELQVTLSNLSLRNPMSIENLLNPTGEDDAAHVELSDSEIIQMARQEEEDETEEETQIDEVAPISKAEKLKSLSVVISLLDLSNEADRSILRGLRQMQMSLRLQFTHQSTLDAWLNQRNITKSTSCSHE